MALAVLFISFILLMFLGMPIAFVMGLSSLITIIYLGLPPLVIFQRMSSSMNVFALMAIPFFIYAGELMLRGAIAERLIRLAAALVGHTRGGLGLVNVMSSTLFGGISGSAVADASAVGGLMIPQMTKRGYDVDYAVNVTVMSAIIALLIPPSHNMIIYSISAGGSISIADLFTAGILPGILLALALMITAYIVALRRGYPAEKFPGFAALGRIFIVSVPGLLLVAVIIGGVRSGVFTATESSMIATIYALLVTLLVYRSLSWKDFVHATLGAVRTTALVLLVIGTAGAFGWLMALLQVPAVTIEFMRHFSNNSLVIFLMINVLLLFLGTFMDMAPLIIISTPIFLPVVKAYGMDPVHFGIIMILNQGIGLITPPVGSVLFVGCAIGKISIMQSMRTIWPFFLVSLIVLAIITYVPEVSLFLPRVLGK
ncbi:MAG: TRAP transporter large permease [Alphaproteobacteria bacterium]